MTRNEALAILIDIADQWCENMDDTLGGRVNAATLANDELFDQVLSELDEYDREEAIHLRDVLRAIDLVASEKLEEKKSEG
jgi:hypothetical protein